MKLLRNKLEFAFLKEKKRFMNFKVFKNIFTYYLNIVPFFEN